jgi:catechol 2,3-dioxygenase-like lactoylglutathione lyase family enzyme
MRGQLLFVAGLLVGLAVEATNAQNQRERLGIIGVDHVGMIVPNLDEAVAFYTKKMGFVEAWRNFDAKGKQTGVVLQIGRSSFLEMQPAGAQRPYWHPAETGGDMKGGGEGGRSPLGISHLGLAVENMGAAAATLKERGVNVETHLSRTGIIVGEFTDPNGIDVEMVEHPPTSEEYKAIERWK